ncbi:50S ribosomal protein L24 [Litorivicinus sp.]|jgi:large subunit ribosomal protein L24|nr:50S ribosomal protein L24 [Litorivicinus sp.]MDC1208374.1 50S ribosomal protein L24 [Litorivicinus sp.]MDC1240639.1 50S ribosomal protein L24 [Litorivicinus sp.]|tara:strand:+ start:5633 stop:5953 length:321 start_codon:yes stop_codon:yes gene_type:complete
MAAKIRRDDDVVVITGKDKGRRGKVLAVRPDGRVLVAGINLVKKHTKPNPMLGQQGGIIEKEAALHISNIALFNPESDKPERVGFRVNEDGTKSRIFRSTNKEVGV